MSQLNNKIDALSENKKKLLALLKKKKLAEASTKQPSVKPYTLISAEDKNLLPPDVEDAYPISILQMGMLHHMDLGNDGDSPADYHNLTTFRCRVKGDFQSKIFQQSIDKIVRQHDNLRTSFDLVNYSMPLQLVHKSARLPMGYEDLRALSDEDKEQVIKDYVQIENNDLFDISKAPLMRFYIHQLEDNIISLSFTEPHSISDGWSTHLTIIDIFDIYFYLLRGEVYPLIEPESKYCDFINEELIILKSQEAHDFWDRRLTECVQTELPLLGREIAEQEVDIYTHKEPFSLPRELVKSLHEVVERTGVPLKGLFLAVHFKFLSLVTGQNNVTTGLAFNGRLETENSTQMRGLFLNTLPVNMNLSDGSWRDLVKASHAAEMELVPFRRFPFGVIQKKYGSQPVFHTHLGFLHFHTMTDKIKEKNVEKINNVDLSKTNFDLSAVFCLDAGDKYKIDFLGEVNLDKVSKRQFVSYLDYYVRLIEDMVHHLDEPHNRRTFLSKNERRLFLYEWNSTEQVYNDNAYIHELFEVKAAQYGDKTAAQYGEQNISYGELNNKANQVANHMRAQGVKSGELIGICLDRSVLTLVGMIAILKVGGAYLPLDPEYPQERLTYMFDDANVKVLISQSDYLDKLPITNQHVICLDCEGQTEVDWQVLSECSTDNLSDVGFSASSEQMAYIIYTSGSTGNPKGVQVTHANVISLIEDNIELTITHQDVVAQASNASFDAATYEFWGALLNGALLTGVDKETLLSPTQLKAQIVNHQISVLFVTTALFNRVAEDQPDAFSTLNKLLFGGEAHSLKAIETVLMGSPPKNLIHVYGPTECTTYATSYRFDRETFETFASAPIGKPLSNHVCYVLDKKLELVPVGSVGELHIGGAGVALGYLNRSDLTAEKFIVNPYEDSNAKILYKSGDTVRLLNDGNIEFVGRVDNQVKVRGFRIELDELSVILQSSDHVKDSAVLVREDEPGDKRLVAYLVLTEEAAVEDDAIELVRDYLQAKLPDYMVPTIFSLLDEMPLTPNGKIDRKALPVPDYDNQFKDKYVAPTNNIETALCEIWQDVLRIKQVGISDNFFASGGDSILSIQVVSKANRQRIEINTRDIFKSQTIQKLALCASAKQNDFSQQASNGQQLLLPIQDSFLHSDDGELNHFHQSAILTVPEGFTLEFLRAVLPQMYRRHDVLRLRYAKIEGQWQSHYQDVSDHQINDSVSQIDIPEHNGKSYEENLEVIGERIKSGFDIENGPLIKAVYLKSSQAEQCRLMFVIHHLVVDGVSWRILFEDLTSAFNLFKAGKAVKLPSKTSAYQAWGRELQEYSQSEALLSEKSYWMSQLSADVQTMSASLAQIQDNSYAQSSDVHTKLNASLTTHLLGKCHEAYRTQINELLLSGLMLALNRWNGQTELRLTMEGHGREEIIEGINLSQTMGWFTCVYPLLLDISANMDTDSTLTLDEQICDVICNIKESVRKIPKNGIGYGILTYLSQDQDIIEAQQDHPGDIVFNYLGQFDQQVGEDALFQGSTESTGQDINQQRKRSHVLDINSMVTGGELNITFNYNRHQFDQSQIEQLGEAVQTALEDIIKHCMAPQTGAYTPADFPLAQLQNSELVDLQNDYPLLEDVYPTSSMQSGLIFHNLLNDQKDAYVNQTFLDLRGELDLSAFRRAWHYASLRHSILRTAFVGMQRELPLQLVVDDIDLDWVELDWREKSEQSAHEEFEAYRYDDKHKGFDFAKPGLMRFAIFRLTDKDFRFLWTHHHTLMDGWSQPILFGEVFSAYQSFTKSQNPVFAALPPYRDYIQWTLEQPVPEAKTFWQDELGKLERPTRLTVPAPVNAPTIGHIQEFKLAISEQLTSDLQKIANNYQITLNTLIQGAWGYLLHRYSGEQHVVFGETLSGRDIGVKGADQMVGLFIKTLPACISFDHDLPLREFLQNLHAQQVKRDKFSYLPLVDIQQCSQISASSPMFNIAMVFENFPIDSAPDLGEHDDSTQIEIVKFDADAQAHFELSLLVAPAKELTFALNYLDSVFDAEMAEQVMTHLTVVLSGFVDSNVKQVSQLPLLTSNEEQKLVIEFNNTQCDLDDQITVPELFEVQVTQTPDNVAVLFEDTQLSYRELNNQANQLAKFLMTQGVTTQSLVVVHFERSVQMIIAVLAIMKAGGAYVPLDPIYPLARKVHIIDDSGAKLILTQNALVDVLPESAGQVICLDDEDFNLEPYSTDNVGREENGAHAHSLAYVIYTSGSTGKPKGVLLEHTSLVNLATRQQELFGVDGSSQVLQFASLGFDAATWELVMTLMQGAALHVITAETVISPTLLTDYVQQHGITHATLPPALLVGLDSQAMSSIHTMVVAGEAISEDLAAKWSQNRRLFNAYGPTENTVCISVSECDGETVNIGRPIGNVQCYVLDEKLRLVPPGSAGELFVGGKGLARSYLNLPKMTQEKFVANPFDAPGNSRLYRTGDIVRWLADGNLDFIGRVDNQVKVRGFRIELGDVEAAINGNAAVNQCAVLLQKHGEYDNRLVAYLDLLDNTAEEDEQKGKIRDYLKTELPAYMMPSHIYILDSLPLNHNGKIDRKALHSLGSAQTTRLQYTAPRFGLEEQLSGLWQDILKVERVSIYDNFFDLGGNSLLAVRIRENIISELGVDISIVDLFNYPTIAQLVEFMSQDSDIGQVLVEEHRLRSSNSDVRYKPIAVIGVSGRMGNTDTVEEFWQQIKAGDESIETLNDELLAELGVPKVMIDNPSYVKSRAPYDGMADFDAGIFGFNAKEAQITDPQHRILLECAYEALEVSGYPVELNLDHVGVFVGKSDNVGWMTKIFNTKSGANAIDGMEASKASSGSFLSTQLSYKLNLSGPSINLNTACSTSLVAIHQACLSLQFNECSMALAGGISVSAEDSPGYLHMEGFITSKDGHCRPFDADSSGTRVGKGAGMVLLKPLSQAVKDGDTIHAVIRGSAINNDGSDSKVGYTAPSVDGQAKVIATAMALGEISPLSIGYIETHGTGTFLGDPIELRALGKAYDSLTDEPLGYGKIALGAVKANIGHLDAAAGVAGFIKTVWALKNKQLPPMINYDSPNPELNIEQSPFYVNQQLTDWPDSEEPRRAAVSSFGIGGTNAHVVLEEAPQMEIHSSHYDDHLLVLSARSEAALKQMAANLLDRLASDSGINLPDVAHTLQCGRKSFEYKHYLVCDSVQSAVKKLKAPFKPHGFDNKERAPAVVFMFPGQGVQYVGMLQNLYHGSAFFRDEVNKCVTLFNCHLDQDLHQVIFSQPTDDEPSLLYRTDYTQPALFCLEYSLAQYWLSLGVKPAAMIGHSIGEYVAACMAGVFEVEDAVKLVSIRGRLMQSLAPGKMLSLGASHDVVEKLAKQFDLSVAASNADTSYVLSGHTENIEQLQSHLIDSEIAFKLLRGEKAFHSSLTQPILARYQQALETVELKVPTIGFMSNVSGEWITPEQAIDSGYWVSQLRCQVKFAEGIKAMADSLTSSSSGQHSSSQNSVLYLEVGPGKVLSGLVSQILPTSLEDVIPSSGSVKESLLDAQLQLSATAKLWQRGVVINWRNIYSQENRRFVGLPTYPFERKRYWIEDSDFNEIVPQQISKGGKVELSDWFYAPTWHRTPLTQLHRSANSFVVEGATCLMLMDSSGLAEETAQQLEAKGIGVIRVLYTNQYYNQDNKIITLDYRKPLDYLRLINELKKSAIDINMVFHFWGVDTEEQPLGSDNIDLRKSLYFYSVVYLLQAVKDLSNDKLSLYIVTAQAQEVIGSEIVCPVKSMVVALSKSACAEYKHINSVVIDVQLEDQVTNFDISKQIISEMGAFVSAKLIALRHRFRYTEVFEKVSMDQNYHTAAAKIKEGGVYVIFGGLGGMGQTAAEQLSVYKNITLVLASRRAFHPQEQWFAIAQGQGRDAALCQRLIQLSEQCQTLQVVTCNIDNGESINSVLTGVKNEFGNIDGLIHSAGVPGANKPIAELNQSDYNTTISSKSVGLLNLEQSLKRLNVELDFVLLMSSLQTVVDSHERRSDYGAANRFMDAYANIMAQNLDTTVQVINWNTWKDSGMAVDVTEALETSEQVGDMVHNSTSDDEGRQIMEFVLSSSFERVAICATNLDILIQLEQFALQTDFFSETADSIDTDLPVEEQFDRILMDMFGLKEIDMRKNIYSIGGDSLAAIRISAQFNEQFGVTLSMAEILGAESIQAIYELLCQRLNSEVPVPESLIKVQGETQGPLSFAQQRLWFIDTMEGNSSAYNQSWAIKLSGTLDQDSLEKALQNISQRHEVLRTVYVMQGDTAMQKVIDNVQFKLEVSDYCHNNAAEQQTAIKQHIEAEGSTPFDLENDLMLRAQLLKLADYEHVLLFTQHHISTDGFSMGRLFLELSQLYNAGLSGQEANLPTLPIQYLDYSIWQREYLSGELFEQQMTELCDALADLPLVHNLPLDHARPLQQSYRGDQLMSKIDVATTDQLVQLCQDTESTMFMVLQATLMVFIARYSGESDIVIGSPIANRAERETVPLIGFFVNTLVLRAQIDGEKEFTDLLGGIKENTFKLYENQHIPFELLVEKLNPQRSLGQHPLVQIMLVLQDKNVGSLELKGLDVATLDKDTYQSKFDISLNISETQDGLEIVWEYATDLFDRNTIASFADSFITLLNSVADNAQQKVADMPLLSDQAKTRLLVDLNDTQVAFVSDACVYRQFENQVKTTPDNIALVCNGDSLTYRELNAKANQLAHYLNERGISEESLVALCMERSIEMVVAIWGTLKACGAYIPMDPELPPARLAIMLQDSKARYALTQQHLQHLFNEIDSVETLCLDDDGITAELDKMVDSNPKRAPQSSLSCAYVIYTSGSTGLPKGVVCTHQGLVNRIDWMQSKYQMNEQDVVLQKTPYSFDVSVWEFVWPFMVGASLVMAKPQGQKDPQYLSGIIKSEGVTVLHFVPSMLNTMLIGCDPDWRDSVKQVFCSGEALHKELQDSFFAHETTTELHNLYGPTEASIDVSYWQCKADCRLNTVPIGKPINNTQLVVLDKTNQLVPFGVIGELHIGGKGLARGYLNKAQLTAELFIANPFDELPTDRLYKTGDLVRLIGDGELEYISRIDDQIKLRGFRIELGEIENQLAEQNKVQTSLVMVRKGTSGQQQLVAYVTLIESALSHAHVIIEMRDQLVTILPEYMVPTAFIVMDEMPLTANGKVNRKALPEPDESNLVKAEYAAPESNMEVKLSEIWQELLNIENVGTTDNFFSLGGDSIMSTQLVARARKEGLIFSVKDLFNHQTIAGLIPVINKNKAIEAPQHPITGDQLLIPVQKRFFEMTLSDPNHYNQTILLNAPTGFEQEHVIPIVEALITRHDVFRLRFDDNTQQYCYIEIADLSMSQKCAHFDLSELPEQEQQHALTTNCDTLQASLHLVDGPVMRAAYFDLGSNGGRLLIVCHHMVIDGVSWRVVFSDLDTAWQQLSVHGKLVLGSKTSSYQQWGEVLQVYAGSQKLLSEQSYWAKQLAIDVPPLNHADIKHSHGGVNKASSELNKQQTTLLLGDANQAYRTRINELLLSGLLLAYKRWADVDVLRLNMEGHGREIIDELIDLSETVGWFTTMYPLILTARGGGDTGELIKQVKDQYRMIPENGIGYGVLRYIAQDPEIIALEADNNAPVVLFNYLGQFDSGSGTQSSVTSASGTAVDGFTKAKESEGRSSAEGNKENESLIINSVVVQGMLHIECSSTVITKDALQILAQTFSQCLNIVIDECIETSEKKALLEKNKEILLNIGEEVEGIEI
ncbi:MAG: amino acid adenylation domain-containing protein [Alteromonadaceae bacterium]|nr:amino acid adenylation domain-containing protein [Alteromonadaceae bacterium]